MTPTSEPRVLCVETIADLPVLWAILEKIRLRSLLEKHFPPPQGWQGPLSPADVFAVWICYLLSQADHRLNHVEPWAQQHQFTLTALLGKTLRPVHLHDDRLADCLDRIANNDTFRTLEADLNASLLRVYCLPTDTVRIDTTTVNSAADILGEHGLLQFGHSKDDPSRPQIKIAIAALAPLGLPLATAVVPGNKADDPLYIPVIKTVQASCGTGARLYVGDCKMASLQTRAFVADSGDFYLCPLSESQLGQAERAALLQPVWDGRQALEVLWRQEPEGASQQQQRVAEGCRIAVPQQAEGEGKRVCWQEQRWLVRSVAYARTQEEGLERRLAEACAALQDLVVRRQGKKELVHYQLLEAAAKIVQQTRVEGLVSYTFRVQTRTRRVRGYGGQPAREEVALYFEARVQRQEEQIAQRKRELGWQVYATNRAPLGLAAVVWTYRGQYRLENDWARLKGQPLGLMPLYLQKEERMRGLVHLLSVALRVLLVVEWTVRERLHEQETELRGVYAGQPGRKTKRPSAELLLSALKTIHVSVIEMKDQIHVLLIPLTPVQKRLLDLWGLPPNLYESVVAQFPKNTFNTSEP
jgi:transposase